MWVGALCSPKQTISIILEKNEDLHSYNQAELLFIAIKGTEAHIYYSNIAVPYHKIW